MAGAHVDAGRRLVQQQQFGLAAAAPGPGTRAAAGRPRARGCGGRRAPPMPSRSSTSATSALLGAARPRQAPAPAAGHQHAFGDRDREVPVDGLDLRDVADPQAARRRRRCRRRAGRRPSSSAQQRRLARAGRARRCPTNSPGAIVRSTSSSTGVAVVAHGDAVDRSEVDRRDAAHCGYSARVRARRSATSNAFSAAASPPSASVIVT